MIDDSDNTVGDDILSGKKNSDDIDNDMNIFDLIR